MSATLTSCSVSDCAFNHNGCSAPAITMGNTCSTFSVLDILAGHEGVDTSVATCSRTSCAHNDKLICTADVVTVGGNVAFCESFSAR
ncbi:DUF1540 domain-containing protein [Stomatohabitans albus]|uniref:DUF1540 domain-containing protein n=1 Tax=Stomatohabitans albus TaxID=3110766 RepID=UPI00300CDC14